MVVAGSATANLCKNWHLKMQLRLNFEFKNSIKLVPKETLTYILMHSQYCWSLSYAETLWQLASKERDLWVRLCEWLLDVLRWLCPFFTAAFESGARPRWDYVLEADTLIALTTMWRNQREFWNICCLSVSFYLLWCFTAKITLFFFSRREVPYQRRASYLQISTAGLRVRSTKHRLHQKY